MLKKDTDHKGSCDWKQSRGLFLFSGKGRGMSAGQKYNKDVKERAYALFDTYNNMEFISRKLGVPVSTLWGWKRKYDKATENDPAIKAAREKQKAEFVRSAWRSINMTQELLERRLRRAVEDEDVLEELFRVIKTETGGSERREILKRVAAMKYDDIGKLTQALGILYEKQALANREETEILGGSLSVERFEDL